MTDAPQVDTDVIVVGAAPTGLMLASELSLAGVRPLVLDRLPEIREVPKAGGVGGQILELLRYRGLLERLESASGVPRPAPRYPFGGVHVDLTGLLDPPMQAVHLPQPQLEHLLQDLVAERGAEVRRGHEVVGLSQDDATVTAEVRTAGRTHRLRARYLVGCDGVHSSIRELAGIEFPGVTYPEVNRLGQVTMPDSVTLRDDGDYEVTGLGRLRAGFTQTDRGVFAISSYTPDDLSVYTSEEESREYDDRTPLTPAELRASIRRVLGVDVPLGKPTRMSRFTFHGRQAERYRAGRVLVAGDAAHQFPATGVALNAGMLDTVNLGWKLAAAVHGWAPATLLDTYHDERHLAGARTMLHTRAQVALRRGLDPAAAALRELFSELLGDEQAQRRLGALIAGADIRYPVPAADPHALAGTFAPDLVLRIGGRMTSTAELMRGSRPVLIDLANRRELRAAARGWQDRIDIHTARTDARPADAILIRPDAHIAWAATVDESDETVISGLHEALGHWFGAPR